MSAAINSNANNVILRNPVPSTGADAEPPSSLVRSKSNSANWQAKIRRLLGRPAISAGIAALVVLLFFWITTDRFFSALGIATWLESAATIGIMAVPVGLLMTGESSTFPPG